MSKKPREIQIVGDKAYLPLTQGFTAVVDAEDVPKLEGFCWHVHVDKTNVYARRTEHLPDGSRKTVSLHRAIIECPDDKVVDHKDGNGLNNIKVNLRVCDPVENAQNLKLYESNSTGAPGVQHYSGGRYRAQIRHNTKLIHLGLFDTIEEASSAYEVAKRKLHGEFIRPTQERGGL